MLSCVPMLIEIRLVDHETMVGLKKIEAGSDLVKAKKPKTKASVKEEFEEWEGFGS